MRFDGFVGNAAVKASLSADIDAGRFPHAVLIEGPEGSGRHTLAALLARAAVCEGAGAVPCGECRACRKAADGNHPDIATAEGSGVSRTVSVDTVRALREQAYILPNEAARRVFILPDAGNMNEAAQNALLKVLEEPPAQAVFLLICENRSQLLQTVQSRCICVTLGGVTEEEALPFLRGRLPDADEEELRRALAVFGGRIGQVLSGMEADAFRRVLELTPAVARAVVSPRAGELMMLTAGIEKEKDVLDGVLNGLSLLTRDALVIRAGGNGTVSTDPDAAREMALALSAPRLMALMRATEELRAAGRRNMNPGLLSVYLCTRLRAAAGK